jgi:hypothetical protein
MNNLEYICCFCNRSIESSKTDPTDINIAVNVGKKSYQQANQTLYCHVQCFREKLHDAMKMHFHLHNILDESDMSREELFRILSNNNDKQS